LQHGNYQRESGLVDNTLLRFTKYSETLLKMPFKQSKKKLLTERNLISEAQNAFLTACTCLRTTWVIAI